MADIFISYKREDRAKAEQLAHALEHMGFTVWWDFQLLSGDRFRKVIREVIDQCHAVVVLWSERAVESDFVLDEATHAKRQGKLYPARLDGAEPPFGFGGIHADDLSDWDSGLTHPGFLSLVKSLEQRIGRAARFGPRSPQAQAADSELDAFKAAQLAETAAALKLFLRNHPRGLFAGFVREQLDAMGADTGPDDAQTPPHPTPNAETDENKPPKKRGGALRAMLLIMLLLGGGVGVWVFMSQQHAAHERQLESERRATAARAAREAEDSAFRFAERTNTIAAYNAYLGQYPSGRHADTARANITTLREPQAAAARPEPYALSQLHPEVRAAVRRARAGETGYRARTSS